MSYLVSGESQDFISEQFNCISKNSNTTFHVCWCKKQTALIYKVGIKWCYLVFDETWGIRKLTLEKTILLLSFTLVLTNSNVYIRGRGGVTTPIYLKLQESRSKAGHIVGDLASNLSQCFPNFFNESK